MERVSTLLLISSIVIFSSVLRSKGQINTACTTTILNTYTPCFNYLTGSSGNGSSPIQDCCDMLKSAMTDRVDCACLVISGNVPVGIPFVRSLVLSLPQMCNSGVPVQCKGSGVPLPAPGPAVLSPPPHSHPPANSPGSKKVSKAEATVTMIKMEKLSATPPAAAAPPKSLVPNATPARIRPVLVDPTSPTSANNSSKSFINIFSFSSPLLLLLLFL